MHIDHGPFGGLFVCVGPHNAFGRAGFQARHLGLVLREPVVEFVQLCRSGFANGGCVGAKFILGFPNGNSHPIFVKNLRFKDYPLDKLIIGRFPFWEKYYLRSDQPLTDNGGLYADEQEIYEWKSREHPGQVHRAVVGDSFAWGMVRGKTIRGIRLDFLEVGGISRARAEDLPKLMQGLFSSSKTWFLHVQMHETHPYHHFFKWSEKGHTLIIYDLDHFFDEKNSFGMMPGIKDTY